MLYRVITCLLIGWLLVACIPPTEASYEGVVIDINDPVTQRIYDFQHQRRADSLLTYFNRPNPSYRYLAARSLGSFPSLDDKTIDSLATLLDDQESLVRLAAAYALGQSGEEDVAPRLVQSFDATGRYRDYNSTLLAAVGKVGDEEDLTNVATISTYTEQDTALMSGRAWSLYYFGLRGLTEPAGTDTLFELLVDPATPPQVRHPAAHYFHRMEISLDTTQDRQLRQLLRNENDPVVAMGAIRALGRTGSAPARVALLRRLDNSQDWRERVEILKALGNFGYPSVRESVVEALRDPHPLVALTAADFFIDNGIATDALFYRQLAAEDFVAAVSSRLYRAANRHLPLYLTDYRDRITYTLRQAYDAAEDPYVRADLLSALAEFAWMYRAIYDLYQQSQQPIVRTAAAECLRTISERDDFNTFFRGSSRRVRYELSTYFRDLVSQGEVGPAYHAANALAQSAEVYRPFYPNLDWLSTALLGFELPREIETYEAVVAARRALVGEDAAELEIPDAGVEPIDWELLRRSGKREVLIRSEQGRIVAKLWPEVAPATVASFLRLAESGYYDDKRFHRVVPNFVAQGGGPRGDGFGAEDFALRTETPPLHWDRAGLLGMASAGKDTEGVQFFITHRPTPHLDGKYTIFGEVIGGQEVVDQLLPGSRIESIQLR